jgi:hypothetical protein
MGSEDQTITISKESWIKTNFATIVIIILITASTVAYVNAIKADVDSKTNEAETKELDKRVTRMEEIQAINTELLFTIAKKLEIDVTSILQKYLSVQELTSKKKKEKIEQEEK